MIWRRTLAMTAAAWMFATAPSFAQTLGQGVSPDVPWWRVLGALIVCLGLAAGGAFALRHKLGGRLPPLLSDRKRRLELVETLRLSHQIDICLIRCNGADIIVAATPHGAVVLPQPSPAPSSETAP